MVSDSPEDVRADDEDTRDECIICNEGQATGTLKAFTDTTWHSFKKATERRLALKSDRYRDACTSKVNRQQESSNARYHSNCYRNYTAVKRPSAESDQSKLLSNKPKTRRTGSMPDSDAKGLLKGSCIFCLVVRKTVNKKVEPLSDCLTRDGCESICAAAPKSSNERVKALVRTGVDLIAKEAQYHKSCRREFFREVESRTRKNEDNTQRQLHLTTFEAISTLIEDDIIRNRKAMLCTSVLELYKSQYVSAGGTQEDIQGYTGQSLMKKIMDKFGDMLSISMYNARKGNFMYSSSVSEENARNSLHNDNDKHLHMIRTAALHLRSVIQEMPKSTTPADISVEALKACSSHVPEEIKLFFKTLMCGLQEPSGEENREAVNRKVTSMSSDAIYNTSRGTLRPWKQTVLGLGLGTLTGSKLILRILNRLGHSLSYDEVKSLETEFAYTAEVNDTDAPYDVDLNPNRGTGLAWDNYDVYMDTIDGKDTLHATVGICYQNRQQQDAPNEVQTRDCSSTSRSGRKRRHYEGKEREIDPYFKQLKKAKFDIPSPEASTADEATEHSVKLRTLDFYWMLQCEVERPMPLFPGFYSQYIEDSLPQQKIWYMDPISAPPTRNDVVRETMKRSMNVVAETKQQYGVVTYDLAVALKAYSIQALDAPLFDKLLIMLGNFHLELAFYGAVGTFISESGAEHLLTESGILAEGSLMGFIHGKYYNRCVRIHDLLALVMERKMYDSFLSSLTQEKQGAIIDLIADIPQDQRMQEAFLEDSAIFKEHMSEFEAYFQTAIKGNLGPTAKYWSVYVYMINRVHRDLMRAVHTNDVEGYLSILPEVIDIFFALNRPNYARWGILFLSQLSKAAPQCRALLEAGAFSIRRTEKNFSRSAIDLTLEQTVNRDAASPMRGIVGFHYSRNAIRRWCITSTQRGMAVTELRNMTGLETVEQPTTQLRPSRIDKDSRHRDALFSSVTESCDPFSSPATASACLLNIATGKAASEETQDYLTNTLTAGHDLRVKFQEDCAADPERLLKPIPRRKVTNFAHENAKKGQRSGKGRPAAEGLRDVFIRMLVVISKTTSFDLAHVLTYPITEYPLSITHSDGTGLKSVKSKLLKKLEGLQDGFAETALPSVEATLIDGGFLIHSYLSALGKITSYGNLARSLLAHVCTTNSGKEIHVLFDTYHSMSLKESERRLRGANDCPFVIAGPEQAPKQNCQKLLQNGIFKDQLAQFMLKEWRNDHYGAILQNKTLVVSHGGNCVRMKFSELDAKMLVDQPLQFQGHHEEADTLIAYHASQLRGNLMIRASDTDVMVILLGMLGRHMTTQTVSPCSRIIMDCGSGNKRRYIDVSDIATSLEAKQKGLAAAMPGLHAFTGSDFTTSFYRKGKVKPLEVLEKDQDGTLIEFFCKLSSKEDPDQSKAEEFICSLYGIKGLKNVNEARHTKLCQMTGKVDKVCTCRLIFTHLL